ncbi:MAG: amidohydrolase family protein, partial [Bacilli bacterium]|nr:amidohydrolase family protein [Bacilli bacterium]
MIQVIKNGTVITMDEKRKKKYENLDIVITDDTITSVEENYQGPYDKIIDATNKIVLPGLINCHTHLGMSIFRATNDNLTLQDWLTKKIWPIEDHMTDEDVYYTTLLSCIEMIKTGTTTSNDMYFGVNGALKAIKETKVRSVFSRCLTGRDEKALERIEEFKKLVRENQGNDLLTFTVTPHSMYTCDK